MACQATTLLLKLDVIHFTRRSFAWSGIPESNWRLYLGKVAYYHYTNPAQYRCLSAIALAKAEITPAFIPILT